MTDVEKLTTVKSLLGITDNTADALLTAYLSLASAEILAVMYASYPSVPENAELPDKYNTTQIMAVVEGYSQRGAEGETAHRENGIDREWSNADMTEYIRKSVTPYVRVV